MTKAMRDHFNIFSKMLWQFTDNEEKEVLEEPELPISCRDMEFKKRDKKCYFIPCDNLTVIAANY